MVDDTVMVHNFNRWLIVVLKWLVHNHGCSLFAEDLWVLTIESGLLFVVMITTCCYQ